MKNEHRIGKKFGRLTIIEFGDNKEFKSCSRRTFNALCSCGKVVNVLCCHIVSGHTTSCGCYAKERLVNSSTTHGGRDSNEYSIWCNMKARCMNKNNPNYRDYGGRGIKVCDSWLEFGVFISDMGHRPVTLTIDRINNDGDYEPGNCRWASRAEQSRNKRNNRNININGKSMCIKDWADEVGVDRRTIQARLRLGWSEKDSVMGKS